MNNIHYTIKSLFVSLGERPRGYCSKYSTLEQEEEFVELFSFVLFNRRRKRFFEFDEEIIDLEKDAVLKKKVDCIRRCLGFKDLMK